jgi:hypothetical protein
VSGKRKTPRYKVQDTNTKSNLKNPKSKILIKEGE